MMVRVPASDVKDQYPLLVAQLLAPVKGRKPLDPSRIEWSFEYSPTVSAGCIANMLGRREASDRYHQLGEDDQVADFERNCTVHLIARQRQRVRRSERLPDVPRAVLEKHRQHVRLENEWRERSGRQSTVQAAAK